MTWFNVLCWNSERRAENIPTHLTSDPRIKKIGNVRVM